MSATVIATSSGIANVPLNTSLVATLPAGLQVGDRLFFSFAAKKATLPAPPTGWTNIDLRFSNAGPCRLWERIIDGTEPADLAFVVHPFQNSLVSYAFAGIRNSDNSTPAEFSIVQQIGGTTSPNPPPVAPSWSGDTLFMVLLAWYYARGTRPQVSSYPTGFDDGQIAEAYDDDLGMGIAFAFHNQSTPDDPGPFTMTSIASTACYTIATKSA